MTTLPKEAEGHSPLPFKIGEASWTDDNNVRFEFVGIQDIIFADKEFIEHACNTYYQREALLEEMAKVLEMWDRNIPVIHNDPLPQSLSGKTRLVLSKYQSLKGQAKDD